MSEQLLHRGEKRRKGAEGVAKIYDSIEIALTRDELRQALRCWMDRKALITEYTVTDVTLRPEAKFCVRFTVEPPLAKSDQKVLKQSTDEKTTV